MLGKLIKQEFRATARIMLPVSGAVLVLALLANLSIRGLSGNMSNVPALRMLLAFIVFAYGAAIVAAAVMAMVIMINRFYRNLLKDEGYLKAAGCITKGECRPDALRSNGALSRRVDGSGAHLSP